MASDRVEFLTGVIGQGMFADITMESVREQLGAGDVTLVIHSPGGDAATGAAIAGVVARHKGRVRVEVDGVAASAASLVAVAGDELVMSPGAMLMIHEPRGLVIGTKDDMSKVARTLETFTDAYADYYAAHTPLTKAQALEYMAAETWFTAAQAAEIGIAKEEKTGRKKPTAPMARGGKPKRKDDDRYMRERVAAELWHGIAAPYEGSEKQGLTRNTPAPTVNATMNRRKMLDAAAAGGAAPTVPAAPTAEAPGQETMPAPVKPPIDAPFAEVELTDGTPCFMVPQAQWHEAQQEITSLRETIADQQERIAAGDREKLEGKVEQLLSAAMADGRITSGDYDVWRDRLMANYTAMAPVVEGLRKNVMYTVKGSSNGALTGDGQVLTQARRNALAAAGWTDEQITAHAAHVAGVAGANGSPVAGRMR